MGKVLSTTVASVIKPTSSLPWSESIRQNVAGLAGGKFVVTPEIRG
jgi:hypothetical protein